MNSPYWLLCLSFKITYENLIWSRNISCVDQSCDRMNRLTWRAVKIKKQPAVIAQSCMWSYQSCLQKNCLAARLLRNTALLRAFAINFSFQVGRCIFIPNRTFLILPSAAYQAIEFGRTLVRILERGNRAKILMARDQTSLIRCWSIAQRYNQVFTAPIFDQVSTISHPYQVVDLISQAIRTVEIGSD